MAPFPSRYDLYTAHRDPAGMHRREGRGQRGYGRDYERSERGRRPGWASLDANLGTAAMIFGAVEASDSGGVVDVAAKLRSARAQPAPTG
jgi:hypothetical protein